MAHESPEYHEHYRLRESDSVSGFRNYPGTPERIEAVSAFATSDVMISRLRGERTTSGYIQLTTVLT